MAEKRGRKKKFENILIDIELKVNKFLKDKQLYENVDEGLVDELIFNLKIIKSAKDDISERGNLVPISSNGLIGMNPSITIYNKALKNYLDICRKLSLSPFDRKSLKINIEDNEEDLFPS